MKTIDIHTHSFPDKIAKRTVDKLKHASHTVPSSNGTAAGLAASMNKAGVDTSVVLPVATNPLKAVSMNDTSLLAMERAV